MTRDSESVLVSFFVEQRTRFDASAWARFTAVTRPEVAAVAGYLAGVTWYGHQPDLNEVADRLSAKSFSVLAGETGFDVSRFAGLLKAHLRHAGHDVAA
jgi:hypothetical protein